MSGAPEYRKFGHYDDHGRVVLEWTSATGEMVRAVLCDDGAIFWQISIFQTDPETDKQRVRWTTLVTTVKPIDEADQ